MFSDRQEPAGSFDMTIMIVLYGTATLTLYDKDDRVLRVERNQRQHQSSQGGPLLGAVSSNS